MTETSAATSICALASLFRRPNNDQSFDALRRRVWHESGEVPVSERALVGVLLAHPEFVDSWLAYSEDQRSGDAWYVLRESTAAEGAHWVVGQVSSRTALRFRDRAAACAAFVARAVGEPYVTRSSHHEGG